MFDSLSSHCDILIEVITIIFMMSVTSFYLEVFIGCGGQITAFIFSVQALSSVFSLILKILLSTLSATSILYSIKDVCVSFIRAIKDEHNDYVP